MKNFLVILTAIIMVAFQSHAQPVKLAEGVKKTELPVIYLPDNLSVHFVSPEPIQYVDISSKRITGDMPVKNILRIRYRTDTVKQSGTKDAVVTIIGQKFIAQYHVVYSPEQAGGAIKTDIEILPADMRPLDYPGIGLSTPEMNACALGLLTRRPERLVSSKAYGLSAQLNHVYTLGDYIFLDIGFENGTNLPYDIDELRFKITDKKIVKATTMQSLSIEPYYVLADLTSFKKHYRNIFVFSKFSFPGNKVLKVELSEKQFSGRIISLQIPYSVILGADVIPIP